MVTFAELARLHGISDEARVSYLQNLVGSWGLLADLSFADLLLYSPNVTNEADSLVLLGHVRPTTGATLYRADLVGQVFDSSRRPLITQALKEAQIVTGVVPVGSGGEVNLMAIPVNYRDEVIAVVGRERNSPVDRVRSELERTYLTIFDRFAHMLVNGDFPYQKEGRFRHRTPRVGDGLLLVDNAGRIEFASPNAVSLLHRLGWHRGVVGARFEGIGLSSTILSDAYSGKYPVIDEMERGIEVAVVSHCFPLLENDNPIGAVVLVRDVTELRRRDRQLVSKDATIREIHHRVKNNLQTVSSLLRLQSRRLHSNEGREALEESVRRIAAIALVHEILAETSDGEVAFIEVVNSLVELVMEGLSSPLNPVTFAVEGDAGSLPASVATTLAIVVTELVQNAVEHAFPSEFSESSDPISSRVVVRLERNSSDLRIQVVDNGKGLPEGFELKQSAGLGLVIAGTFMESELGGSISLMPGASEGTIAEVYFPIQIFTEVQENIWESISE